MSKSSDRCRICLLSNYKLISLLSPFLINGKDVLLSEAVQECASIQMLHNDGKPKEVCILCSENIKVAYKFKQQCEESDQILQNEIDMNLITRVDIKTELKEECFDNESNDPVEPNLINDTNEEFTSKVPNLIPKPKKPKRKSKTSTTNCPYCPFIAESCTKLGKHMSKEHDDYKTIACTLCDKKFFASRKLHIHMRMHTGEKPYVCEACGKGFAILSNLVNHKRTHTGEKPYICQECGKGFSQHQTMISHQTIHAEKQYFLCPDCGTSYTRADSLRKHQKIHNNTNKKIPCPTIDCNKVFHSNWKLKIHLLSHTGQKDFECEFCHKFFGQKKHLKVHIKMHTGETPHTCEVCGKGFIQAHCLRSHLKTHLKDS